MKKLKTVSLGLLLTANMALSHTGLAAEPMDNAAPWKWSSLYGNTTLYVSTNAMGTGSDGINSSSDVDYLVMACTTGARHRPVSLVAINFTHAQGDLDMAVYDLQGNYLAGSQGVTDRELVDIGAFGEQVVVLKVYGYNGATGNYGVSLSC
jgi:hypothetical protein